MCSSWCNGDLNFDWMVRIGGIELVNIETWLYSRTPSMSSKALDKIR